MQSLFLYKILQLNPMITRNFILNYYKGKTVVKENRLSQPGMEPEPTTQKLLFVPKYWSYNYFPIYDE